MSIPAERLPRGRRQVNRAALARRQGLTEPLRLADGVTRGDMAKRLADAATEMAETIRTGLRAGTLGDLAEQRARAVKASLEATAQRMWDDIHRDIEQGVKDAADLAVSQQLLRDIQLGMSPGIVNQYAGVMSANGLQAAEDILSRHTNGFTLSQRVYRNGLSTISQVGRIVDLGLAQQLSARKIAAQVRGFISPTVRGGTSYAAMRLARTEINNAHHETTIRTSRERPWVTGYTWHLSGSHPRPDICNVYAEDNEGFFSKGEVPSKPHPQCLCYLAIAQEPQAEFIKKLQGGEYDDYLRSRGALDVETTVPTVGRHTTHLIPGDSEILRAESGKRWVDVYGKAYSEGSEPHLAATKAHSFYTGGGKFDAMNAAARNPTLASAEDLGLVADLDSFFSYAGVNNADPIVAYRGIRGDVADNLIGSNKGSVFVEDGFMSVSSSRSVAEGFATKGGSNGIVLEIRVSKGHRSVVGTDSEKEMIFERGSRLRTVGYDEDTRTLTVEMV